jgi:hypothetical protein
MQASEDLKATGRGADTQECPAGAPATMLSVLIRSELGRMGEEP